MRELAILQRSDDLMRVWVPDATHEALRDLVRAYVDDLCDSRAEQVGRSYRYLHLRPVERRSAWFLDHLEDWGTCVG